MRCVGATHVGKHGLAARRDEAGLLLRVMVLEDFGVWLERDAEHARLDAEVGEILRAVTLHNRGTVHGRAAAETQRVSFEVEDDRASMKESRQAE